MKKGESDEMEKNESGEEERLAGGLSSRSFLAILYAIVVFEPALIWAALVTWNFALFVAVSWTTLLLFAEMFRWSGRPLTLQEGAVIFLGTGVVGYMSMWVLGWLYGLYFVHSPITMAFGLTNQVPEFYAPPVTSPVFDLRTFFHPSWYFPIGVSLAYLVFAILADVSLGLLAFQLFSKSEKLPFPMQVVTTDACITLTKREPERLRALSLSSMVSIFYTLLLYTLPFIVQSYGYIFQPIPVPWSDFNFYLHRILPGASFGVATDIAFLAIGLVIPFNVSISLFMGSFALYFIGNHLLVRYNLTTFALEYSFGMSVSYAWQRSILYAWLTPLLGIGIAAGVMPILRRPRIFLEAIGSLRGGTGREKPVVPLWVVLGGFLGSTLGCIALNQILVPGFPLWILFVLSLGWSFVFVLMSSRALAVAGLAFDVPYVRELTFLASGYRAAGIWFAPLVVEVAVGAPTWCGNFKVTELTGTTPLSYAKAWIIAGPFAILLAALYAQSFWRQNPIPSMMYPATEIFWPVSAMIQGMFITRSIDIFNPTMILGGFLTMAAAFLVTDFLHIPFSVGGATAGAITPVPNAFTILLGGIMAIVLKKMVGQDFERYKASVGAGLLLGEGLMVVLGSAVAIIVRSIWLLPF